MQAKVAVSACIISKATNRILLARRVNPPGAGLFCLPGGKINPNEVSRDAVLREIEEEVGLKREDIRLSQPFHVTDVLIQPKPAKGEQPSQTGFHYFIIQYAMMIDNELSYLRAGDDVDMLQWVDPEKDLGIKKISFEEAFKDHAGDIEGILDFSKHDSSWREVEKIEDAFNIDNALNLEYSTKGRAEESRTLGLFNEMSNDHLLALRNDLPVMRSIIPVISKACDLLETHRLYFEQV